MAITGNDIEQILEILPPEIASQIDFVIILLQAIGGLFVIYLMFLLVRLFMLRKQNKLFKAMQEDMILIKKKLKIKTKTK